MGIQKLTKMNKKGLQLKNMVFAVVVTSIIVIAVGVVAGEWADRYNSGITYDLEEFEDLDRFSKEAQSQKEKITPQDPDPGTGDFEGRLFRGGYGILGNIFSPFRSVFNMFEALENRFGLPSYVGEGILTLVFFSIITMIIAIIFRLGRTQA